jgi:PAS domain S-box-containing protein
VDCPRCGCRLDGSEGGAPTPEAGDEGQARLRWLIEHASDIVSEVTPDGTIRYESPSVERLLGWRPDELIGTQVLDYVHPDDVAHVVDAIARRLADPVPVNPPTEFRVRARDGSWRILAAMSRVTRDPTGAVMLVVNSRDVTEQRALEERLRRAERMESVAQLATAAAHEINNPLSALMGQLTLLGAEVPGPQPRIDKALAAAARVADIVHRMTRLTRLEIRESPSLPPMLDIRRSSEEDDAR